MALPTQFRTLNRELERARQLRTGDDKFWKKFTYYFELKVPPSLTNGQIDSYFYPLVLPPTAYKMSEPFALDRSFGNGGSLFIEEQGIIVREITLSGNTGFKPRPFPRDRISNTAQIQLDKKSWSRDLSTSGAGTAVDALSGQRHFQFLQDNVFRTYSDLKKNKESSKGTKLLFHNPKDSESWQVHPLSFDMDRSGSSPLLYPYTIRLLVSSPATESLLGKSEDKEVLDQIGDTYRMVRKAFADGRSAIQDLSKIQNDVRRLALSGTSVLNDAALIFDATESFLEGTESFIRTPHAYVVSTSNLLSAAMTTAAQAADVGFAATELPGTIYNALRKLGDSLDVLASYPERFQTSVDLAVAKYHYKAELSTSKTKQELLDAENKGAPENIRGFSRNSLGSALLPGDRSRAENDLGLGRNSPKYTSATERRVERGDTMANLSAKYLGDEKQWRVIATFNALKPPYISETGVPGTAKIGDTILIPNFEKPQRQRDTDVTLGVRPDQPSVDHLLGIDLRMDPVGGSARELYDLAVDSEQGSTDFKIVNGIDNLKQGLRSRIITERGSDILYKGLGAARTVGIGLTEADLDLVRFRLIETVEADPRISTVRSAQFSSEDDNADSVSADLEVEVRGFNKPITLNVED